MNCSTCMYNAVLLLFSRLTNTSYFTCYHPFLPILENTQTPDEYHESSRLLFWVIISVAARRYNTRPALLHELGPQLSRLLWEQIAEVPQTYLIVKALCVLCTWPLPISSTSSDPTFMLSGLNMQIAMQIGLHRPSHVQDFQKFKTDLMEEELRDRVRTWASCNAVAQRYPTIRLRHGFSETNRSSGWLLAMDSLHQHSTTGLWSHLVPSTLDLCFRKQPRTDF